MALDYNEEQSEPIAKFESMLKTDDVYFFDAEDFEDIIHHYLNNGKVSLAKKAIKMGLKVNSISRSGKPNQLSDPSLSEVNWVKGDSMSPENFA